MLVVKMSVPLNLNKLDRKWEGGGGGVGWGGQCCRIHRTVSCWNVLQGLIKVNQPGCSGNRSIWIWVESNFV